jgi:hypothetical protein
MNARNGKGEATARKRSKKMKLWVEYCFPHPSYWRPNGCPCFSIYQIQTLINSFGDLKGAAEVLELFRATTKEAEFPGRRAHDVIAKLGIGSVDSYVWIHHVRMPDFPTADYT